MTLWVVRAGKDAVDWPLFDTHGFVGISFALNSSAPDIATLDRPAITNLARSLNPSITDQALSIMVAQAWAFAHEIHADDLVLVPRQQGHVLALGRITGDSTHRTDLAGIDYTRDVEWVNTELKASLLATDLKHSLGAIMTVFAPRAPGAVERIGVVATGEPDPGPTDYPAGSGVGAWVFQCDPNRYDLLDHIASGKGDDDWSMNQHRSRAALDDRIWFRLAGTGGGRIVATARITSLPMERAEPGEFGKWGLTVAYEATIDPPLTKAEIVGDPSLASVRPLTGAMGTNLVIDEATDAYLAEFLADRLRPIPVQQLASRKLERDLARRIAQHRAMVEAEVREAIFALDAQSFEHLCMLVLEYLGFSDVEVVGALSAKSLGDGGVDLTAHVDQEGLPVLKIRGQAKRQRANVGPGAIQQLRGTLKTGEQGVFLTASRFTARAADEAVAPGMQHIGLLNGELIARAVIKHGIGVDHPEPMRLPRFHPQAFIEAVAAASAVSDPAG